MNKQNKIKYTKLLPKFKELEIKKFENWDHWMKEVDKYLLEIGYKKYFQQHKNSHFQYFKSIEINGKEEYVIGIYFYDWQQFTKTDLPKKFGTMYECLIGKNVNIVNLEVQKEIDILEFERMANDFYNVMKKFK